MGLNDWMKTKINNMKKNKQCSDCAMDPDTCGCTDADKDENGMCKCFMSKWGYGGGEGGY